MVFPINTNENQTITPWQYAL